MIIASARKKVDQLIASRSREEDCLIREQKHLEKAEKQLSDEVKAHEYIQHVAQSVQQMAHHSISRSVTKCLESIFDDPYEFHVRFDRKRGKTEAHLILTRDGVECEDPLSQVGGGVIDVCSLALRISCILLSKPSRRRLLVLDEPFKNVRGRSNKKRFRDLLQQVADELGFQFILSVDAEAYPEFVLGKTVDLG